MTDLDLDDVAATSRAEFEAWNNERGNGRNERHGGTGFYLDSYTFNNWIAWRAARATSPLAMRELAELRADAERLAALADMGAATAFGKYIAQCITASGSVNKYHAPPLNGGPVFVYESKLAALRAAIDAALAASQPALKEKT